MNTTFPILNLLVKDIIPQELSGGKFKSIEAAREVAKKCQKSKHKLILLEQTAKVLGVEKAFYTMLKTSHVLFIIDGEEASIELLPNKHDILYNAYEMPSREWRWWAMGANLSIMLNCIKKLGATKFQFNADFIIGIIDEETICCLSTENHEYKTLNKYLPPIPAKKVIPIPKKMKLKAIEDEPKPTKKTRKKK